MATLIKIDRNGSKHFEGEVTCDRCGGAGGAENWKYTGWTCYKCGGTGKVWSKWIERTPEYQAKLDAKREAKHKAQAEAFAKAQAEIEAKHKAEEEKRKAEEKARKAISQYVGSVGDKLNIEATYTGTAHFEVKSFAGYGTDTMYVHFFTDANGNKIVWKTTKPLGTWLDNGDWLHYEAGDTVTLKGTIKEHKEYKEEKQTVITRAKVERSK